MTITHESVEAFIRKHATQASIERSRDYLPLPARSNGEEGRLAFCCEGSDGGIYMQTLVLDGNSIRSAACTCPYSGRGICKHAVAALRVWAATAAVQTARQNAQSTQGKLPLRPVSLPFADGMLDFAAAREAFRRHHVLHESHRCELLDYRSARWTFAVEDFGGRSCRLTLAQTADNRAELCCECRQAREQGYCLHGATVLNALKRRFGADCLRADFLERKIAAFLQGYGLTLQDDYADLFEFSFGRNGLEVKHKEPDLMPASFALPEYASDGFQTASAAPEQGLGLVLDFSDGHFVGFTPIIGRYNKQGELALNFKEFSSYSAADMLFSGKLPDWCAKAWHLIEKIGKQWYHFSYTPKPQSGAELAAAFARLTRDFPEMPLFAHPEHSYHTSYARRNLTPLAVSPERVSLEYLLEEDGALYRLTGKVRIGGKSYPPDTKKFAITPCFVRRGDELLLFETPQAAGDMVYCMAHPSIAAPKSQAQRFQAAVLEPLSARYAIGGKLLAQSKRQPENAVSAQRKGSLKNKKQPENAAMLSETFSGSLHDKGQPENAFAKRVYVSEENGRVLFRPVAAYGEREIAAASRALLLFTDAEHRFHLIPRDEAAEREFAAAFQSLHPDFARPDGTAEDTYRLAPAQLLENGWFFDLAGSLKTLGAELFGAGSLKSFAYNPHRPSVSLGVSSGTDWFDVNVELRYGDETADLKAIQTALAKRQDYVLLSDGSKGILPAEWAARLAPYFQAGEIKKDRLRLSHYQFGIIDELYQALETRPDWLAELYNRRLRLQNLQSQPDVQMPQGLNASLRPYQQAGVNWLAFLHANQLGGCLADDMGLGKTLQTLAFLHWLKAQRQPENERSGFRQNPSIIVAPASLVFNWQSEAAKFCPSLRVLDYTGANRPKDPAAFAGYDIVLTTYGTLMQDIATLKDYPFHYAILDESQAVKNPLSQRYKAVRLLNAHNRLILSGTPVENNTFDLYAQFEFLNPGLLGSRAHFKKTFSDPIDKQKDQATAALLAKIVHPFILRRSKEQVARELPAKTESIIYCEMGAAQRKIYEAVKREYRDRLTAQIQAEGIAKSQIHILEGLTRLRQICNSPALADEAYGSESVKLDTLAHTVKEKTGQHKILIFSHFVKMLNLIARRLDAEGIRYEYLDGQTRNRAEKVANFQSNDTVRVFLISTQAGGTGLNLTEADYVFIADPWWNPAVENQAIDRSHRIGQTKPVSAYRLICRDSIEEKIHALQQQKQTIADSIIRVDKGGGKSFDLEEVKALFG